MRQLKNMNIAIRTDASQQIGTGHFMRCLTLANALKQRGVQIRFICRDLPAHLQAMLVTRDVQLALLADPAASASSGDLPHSQWLKTSQTHDADATLQVLSGQTWDWLVVDHYALDARWEKAMRASVKKIMVIDDLADRQHDCDILLDQNFYTDMNERYRGKVPEHCRLLLGPRYALLREEFLQLREQIKPRTGPVKRILVFFGGVDADNCTEIAIDALANSEEKGIQVDVVIGALHPYRSQIEAKCIEYGFVCHVQTDRMAELMAMADLAIGACGSAVWERCLMGLPSIVIVLAENQFKAAKDLDVAGVLINFGNISQLTREKLETKISSLITNETLRSLMSLKSIKLFLSWSPDEIVKIMVNCQNV